MGGGIADSDLGLKDRFGVYMWEAFLVNGEVCMSRNENAPGLDVILLGKKDVLVSMISGDINHGRFLYDIHKYAPIGSSYYVRGKLKKIPKIEAVKEEISYYGVNNAQKFS